MTWGEFKRQVENKGVFDHTPIDYIKFELDDPEVMVEVVFDKHVGIYGERGRYIYSDSY